MTSRLNGRVTTLEAADARNWRPHWLLIPREIPEAEHGAWEAEQRTKLPPGAFAIVTNVSRTLNR